MTPELRTEPLSAPETVNERGKETAVVHYRIPAIARCRLSLDGRLLLESRLPVYQLGEESTVPVNVLLTK